MYRRPKFLEVLLEIRRQMAHEADYDVDLFTEIVRSGSRPSKPVTRAGESDYDTESIEEMIAPQLTRTRDD